MKMNFFFGNIFWGILLVLWGASLILKTFNINMPLAKIFLAVIIIMFGVKLLIGTGSKTVKSNRSPGKTYIRTNKSGEYNMIFSSGRFDLTDLQEDAKDIEITVVFGSAEVVLPSHLQFDIEPTTVFGATVLPEKSQYGFGESHYKAGSGQGRAIHIESNSIFGRIEYSFEAVQGKESFEASSPEADSTGSSSDF
ncbi:MAG: hypothetical protein LHW64_00425 [Candidatus Cloacimonetes bacterium]|nr:hypothetical protein [Candidatus Cloacimonadota bacterium]MCB5286253.1 hypothetical protein [Candidatus Cloacimonadota bacterium]MCK9184515.1 hypothetical protein [Candidatus Cloacimonadota bacterium]MCK9584071.1 hypothetical protein [Candidatus Cloacimonadota bacterium]MDY0228575.1 hypothetical protein [Candidatus Cloacimonadaceae bacterium]